MTDPDRYDLDLLEPLGAVAPPSREVLQRVAGNLHARYVQDTASSRHGRATTFRPRRTAAVVAAASLVAGGLVAGVAAASHLGHGARPAASLAGSPPTASLRNAILTALSGTASQIAYTRLVWTTAGNETRVVDVWTSPFEGTAGQTQTVREVITAEGHTVQDAEMTYVLPGPNSTVPANCNGQIYAPKPPPIRGQSDGAQPTDGRLINVDYVSRSWSDQPDTCIPVTQPTDAAQIRSDIASGDWRVIGHDNIDGQPAVELDLGGPAQPPWADLLWVNAQTFLPIQARASKGGLPAAEAGLVTTYRFLSDTPGNRRNLVTPIPAGFTQTATPPISPIG
jgi:hypothetical protein